MTARLDTPVCLGAPLELLPGEWLHSAISRWAWDVFGVSRAALLKAFGLGSVSASSVEVLGTFLSEDVASNISQATAIDVSRLREATMESLDGVLLVLAAGSAGERSTTVSKRGPWAWQARTRYCPDCLRHRPGVFKVEWRSPWVFACTIHRRVLLDACPTCQHDVVEMRGRNSDRYDPSTCRANIGEKGDTRKTWCRAPLEDTWEHFRLQADSLSMQAQERILQDRSPRSDRDLIPALQSAATALRGAKLYDDIARLSGLDAGELVGLFDEEKHIGISAPSNAYAMAALVGAAYALTTHEENFTQDLIRQATFARPPAHVPRGMGYGPGSPGELLTRWPHAPQPLRAQILRALDRDLTITQRVLFDTAVHPDTRAQHGDPYGFGCKRELLVPEQLWPAWCSRFDVDGDVESETLASALATVARAVGTEGEIRLEAEVQLAAVLRHNMLGTAEQTDRLLAGISELAHTIDTGPSGINYRRRSELPVEELLVREHWEILADSVELDPGAERRHRNARRYLWQRLTATGTGSLPERLKLGRARDDTPQYSAFRTRMTAELQTALDSYAKAFLLAHGDLYPVTWTPDVSVELDWPGPEITDLNVRLLHTMLRDGIYTHRTLADALGVSTRRVARAIDAVPPLCGQGVTDVDWQQLLPLTALNQHEPGYSSVWG